jgi:hypothetical protein
MLAEICLFKWAAKYVVHVSPFDITVSCMKLSGARIAGLVNVELISFGKACATCHPGGSRLEKAGTINNLPNRINTCIFQPLKGKPRDVASPAMQSLVIYIKSLGQGQSK